MAADLTPSQTLRQFADSLGAAQWYDIGFPGARDITFDDPAMIELLTKRLLNNYGDPYEDGHVTAHSKQFEREVIRMVGDYLHAPDDCWGFVATGATAAIKHAVERAHHLFRGDRRDVIFYASTAAHLSVFDAAEQFGLPTVMIPCDQSGQMSLPELESVLRLRRDYPAMIVATVGTTMSEAVDEVAAIHRLCEQLAVRRMLYVDGAHSGLPLAIAPQTGQHPVDFRAGADAMVVSGLKFLGTLEPCAVLIYRTNPFVTAPQRIGYTGSVNTTASGSRSGHTVLRLWWALKTIDAAGHRQRAVNARDLARYTHRRLAELGWETRLNANAFTVLLRTPPPAVRAKWTLAYDHTGDWAHIICAPGVVQQQIDEFIGDLETSIAGLAAIRGHAPADAPPKRGRRRPATAGAR